MLLRASLLQCIVAGCRFNQGEAVGDSYCLFVRVGLESYLSGD